MHKLATLDSLAVYFDTDSPSLAGHELSEAIVQFTDLIAREGHTPSHQFVLKPVSGQGRLVMNKKVDAHTPKTDAELLFQELGFVLDADQYRDALSMVDLFHFYIRQREYRSFRPPQEEFEKNRNRALWKFATSAIRSEVHEKHRQWSWEYFAERRNDRKAYVELFKKKTLGTIDVEVRLASPPPRLTANLSRTARNRKNSSTSRSSSATRTSVSTARSRAPRCAKTASSTRLRRSRKRRPRRRLRGLDRGSDGAEADLQLRRTSTSRTTRLRD